MKEQFLLQLKTVKNSNLVTEMFTLASFVAVLKMKEKKFKLDIVETVYNATLKDPGFGFLCLNSPDEILYKIY